jgi:hypothetical protein
MQGSVMVLSDVAIVPDMGHQPEDIPIRIDKIFVRYVKYREGKRHGQEEKQGQRWLLKAIGQCRIVLYKLIII